MVPFSFKSDPVKVACDAKIYIVILGGAWNWESGAFALSCLLAFLIVIPAWAKIREKTNEFAKIQVNPTKSNLFFLFQLLSPKFQLLNNRVHGVDHRPSRWSRW
jgi:hypothetical protein